MRLMYLRHCPRGPAEAASEETVLALAKRHVSPDTEVDIHYPDDFPGAAVKDAMAAQGILNGLYHALETPQLIRKAVEAEHAGYDAVVQANSFDPAVEASKLAVSIPVVGTLKTNLHVAATLAHRVGVTVPYESHIPLVRRIIEGYGLGGLVVGYGAMGVYRGTSDETVLKEVSTRAAQLVEEQGAELILPLGGALIPYRVKPEDISANVGVPVLNTIAVSLQVAELYVRLGLSHSPQAYPRAELGQREFYKTLAD